MLLLWKADSAPGAEWRCQVHHETLRPSPNTTAYYPQKDVKNEGRTDYVYENKGSDDKMSW